MSLPLRWNCFQLDAESIKLFRSQMPKISLLLLMPYMLQDVSLIHLPTYINCIPLLYLRILEYSLTRALTTQLLFGIALAVSNGFLTQLLIKRPNDSILTLFSLVNCHGILARKKNAT